MSKSTTYIRTKKNRENPYVMVDKTGINDPRLSWKAKGILVYMLSKPDDWKIFVADLIKSAKDGRDSVYSGLKELERYGYLERVQLVDENNKFVGVEYIIYERPKDDGEDERDQEESVSGKSVSGKSGPGKPVFGKPVFGKPDTTNNKYTNKEITNNDINNNLSIKERIMRLEVSDSVKSWMIKHQDRLMDGWLKPIESVYEERLLTDPVFLGVLGDVIQQKGINNFERYFRESVQNKVDQLDKQARETERNKVNRSDEPYRKQDDPEEIKRKQERIQQLLRELGELPDQDEKEMDIV